MPTRNGFAERCVLSIKRECLEKMCFFGAQSLDRALREFVAHYHRERNHQGFGNALIKPGVGVGNTVGDVAKRSRLGGMLSYYHRAAA